MEKLDARKGTNEAASVIGGGVTITGDVECAGELQIGGHIIGDVRCGTLFVDEGGEIQGEVQAERLRLSGTIDGTIDTRDLAIESTGRAAGTLTYERLKVNAGGVIEGTLRHRAPTEPAASAPVPFEAEQPKVVELEAAKPRRVYID